MCSLPGGFSLRVASSVDFAAVRAFYNQLIDDMADKPYHPMWDKEGHPSDAYLQNALAAGELWLAEDAEGAVVASLIVNQEANEGYLEVPWKVQAAPGEVSILHAFGVSSRLQGRGLGSAIMQFIAARARSAGQKALRLDLIDFNLPAQKVYLKLGFCKCAEVKLYYEEVGWQLFHMFELPLR